MFESGMLLSFYHMFSRKVRLMRHVRLRAFSADRLGSLAFYGLLIVLLTSDFRILLPRRLWLALHMLAYPVFFLSLIHGIFNGTDTRSPLVFGAYIATAAALLAVTFYRAAAESRARARE